MNPIIPSTSTLFVAPTGSLSLIPAIARRDLRDYRDTLPLFILTPAQRNKSLGTHAHTVSGTRQPPHSLLLPHHTEGEA